MKTVPSLLEKSANENEKILPSGSNFDIISPNVGVIIKENQNVKEGSKEFNKYFNKYSVSDYDKMLNDYIPLQNRTRIQTQLTFNQSQNVPTLLKKKKTSESVDSTLMNNFVDIMAIFSFYSI